MTLRRVFVGAAVVFGLSVWSWCRADATAAHGAPATVEAACTADTTGEIGGNHDEMANRYRTNQPRHWRHVMIGNH